MAETEAGALSVVSTLAGAGHHAVYAGGCVRDRLLGRPPRDIDVATDAPPSAVLALFERTTPVGAAFGVVRVRIGDAEIEVAQLRGPAGSPDPLAADAERRDFTINAMFYDPLHDRIIDPCGGRRDLAARRLRAPGEAAARFADDPQRLLRAARFVAELGFALAPATWKALKDAAPQLAAVSGERIRDELGKLLTQPGAADGLDLGARAGLWGTALPELDDLAAPRARFAARRRARAHDEAWLTLLADLDAGSLIALGERLRLSRQDIRRLRDGAQWLSALTSGAYADFDVAARKRWTRAEVATTARAVAADVITATGADDDALRAALADAERWDHGALWPSVPITGGDLRAAGHRPGPAFAAALRAVEDAQLTRAPVTAEQALGIAEEVIANWRDTPRS